MIDFQLLKSQLEQVITYSQPNLSNVEIDCGNLIDEWWENKKKYFDIMLDRKLIWESPNPVSVSYSPEMQESMFNQFISAAVSFLSKEGHTRSEIDYWEDWMLSNSKSFFSNTVSSISGCEDTDMKIGMKLIKAFKYFNEFKDSEIRFLQDLASQVIQKTKVEGTLCISIHPLDYMTISENNMNWRSCHALDGEYRAGNLSYMLDPSTVVCYIKSNSDTQLRSFPQGMLWNNKKWRVLLHFQKDFNIVYVNRQYPFSSDDLIYELQHTAPMMYAGFGSTRYYISNNGFKEVNGIPLSQNYFTYKGRVINPVEACGGDEQSLQYNDFIYSPHYTPQFIRNDRKFFLSDGFDTALKICQTEIGKRVKCPCCNSEYLTDSDCFVCETCKDQINGVIGYCEDCSSPIFAGDGLYGYMSQDPSRMFCIECLESRLNEGESNGIVEAYS